MAVIIIIVYTYKSILNVTLLVFKNMHLHFHFLSDYLYSNLYVSLDRYLSLELYQLFSPINNPSPETMLFLGRHRIWVSLDLFFLFSLFLSLLFSFTSFHYTGKEELSSRIQPSFSVFLNQTKLSFSVFLNHTKLSFSVFLNHTKQLVFQFS